MDKDVITPLGEPLTIDFGGHMLFVHEPANGKVLK